MSRWLAMILLLGLPVLVAGCAGTPRLPEQPPAAESPPARSPERRDTDTRQTAGHRIAEIARTMVGVPYRFGGTSPAGFDCSGLVYFAYDHVGIAVPRTARAQRSAARRIRLDRLQPGDLLFFDTRWKAGHVGIYVGDGQFVHAPSSGKRVTLTSLRNGYFAERLQHAGRFH